MKHVHLQNNKIKDCTLNTQCKSPSIRYSEYVNNNKKRGKKKRIWSQELNFLITHI